MRFLKGGGRGYRDKEKIHGSQSLSQGVEGRVVWPQRMSQDRLGGIRIALYPDCGECYKSLLYTC